MPGELFVIEPDQPAKLGIGLDVERAIACRQLRDQLGQHLDIVAGLEGRCRDQRAAADFLQGVVEFAEAVSGVDVDQDQPCLCGRELGDHPLPAVGRPDTDSIAGGKTETEKAGGKMIDSLLQFAIGPADVLMWNDQRLALGVLLGHAVEVATDGFAKEWCQARAVNVTEVIANHRETSADGGHRAG